MSSSMIKKYLDDIELKNGQIVNVEILFWDGKLKTIYCFEEERLIKFTELMSLDYIINRYSNK